LAIAYPIKALVQQSGDVVLGEFLESDYIGILDGGTGAGGSRESNSLPATATDEELLDAIRQQMRDNFELARYETYSSIIAIQQEVPDAGRIAMDSTSGRLFYGTGEAWFEVGQALLVQDNITGGLEFGGDIIVIYNTDTSTTSVTVDFTPLRNQINAIIGGSGLNTDGTYTPNANTNFISGATSLNNADVLLDTALQNEINRATGVEFSIISQITGVTNDLANFAYEGHTAAQVSGAGKVGIVYDTTSGKYEPTSDFGVGGFIKFTMEDGSRDDIPLTTTFHGNQIVNGVVEFFTANGTQDDIDLVVNGV